MVEWYVIKVHIKKENKIADRHNRFLSLVNAYVFFQTASAIAAIFTGGISDIIDWLGATIKLLPNRSFKYLTLSFISFTVPLPCF